MGGETEIDYSELTSYGEGEESSGPISGVKVYDGHSWYITTRLSDLTGAEIKHAIWDWLQNTPEDNGSDQTRLAKDTLAVETE